MPRQNRVTPSGDIIATPERGKFMGNRGRLHDEHGNIVRRWSYKCWIICQIEFGDRQRQIMSPNGYTELFFLDEATALSAGHRPCFECRRKDFIRFRDAWKSAVWRSDQIPKAADFDKQLHAERTRTISDHPMVNIDDLPDGAFVSFDDASMHLVFGEQLFEWFPGGYSKPIARTSRSARLLTPPSIVEVLRGGYGPHFHSTLETAVGQ